MKIEKNSCEKGKNSRPQRIANEKNARLGKEDERFFRNAYFSQSTE